MLVFFRINRSNIMLMSVMAMMMSVAQVQMVDKQTFFYFQQTIACLIIVVFWCL